jgi:hypothetical protein
LSRRVASVVVVVGILRCRSPSSSLLLLLLVRRLRVIIVVAAVSRLIMIMMTLIPLRVVAVHACCSSCWTSVPSIAASHAGGKDGRMDDTNLTFFWESSPSWRYGKVYLVLFNPCRWRRNRKTSARRLL